MKARRLFFVCYPESLPNIQATIQGTNADSFAYILHDKDVTVNGELKKPHYHVYLNFENEREFSQIAKRFAITENGIERCKNVKLAIRYLIHADNPEKHAYPPSDIITSDGFALDRYFSNGEEDSKAAEVLDLVISAANRHAGFSAAIMDCCAKGLYSYIRRGASLYIQVYKECVYQSSNREEV